MECLQSCRTHNLRMTQNYRILFQYPTCSLKTPPQFLLCCLIVAGVIALGGMGDKLSPTVSSSLIAIRLKKLGDIALATPHIIPATLLQSPPFAADSAPAEKLNPPAYPSSRNLHPHPDAGRCPIKNWISRVTEEDFLFEITEEKEKDNDETDPIAIFIDIPGSSSISSVPTGIFFKPFIHKR
ncbi:hypothetical protein AVEN_67700-1 [Araneus ventricosus]|uniref:Uncharacterized protein n=1 Tax=Araneus ventricosus TaxID=182803 RepID=A0A4Y2I4T4_ARAVE|nr:hypothetical protein AVEN_67700-1 [Araneus ventricosus]